MSFEELGTNSSSKAGGGGYSGMPSYGADADTEYIRLSQKVTDSVGSILANVSEMSHLAGQLGSVTDTPALRKTLHNLTESSKTIAREAGRDIKVIGALDGGTNAEKKKRKVQQKRLMADFRKALNSFKEVERVVAQRERDYVQMARTVSMSKKNKSPISAADDSDTARLMNNGDEFEFERVELALELNNDLIEEREQGIMEIEETILEVNEIFKDLSTIVVEQGEMLEEVDNHVEVTVQNTDAAATDLRSANEYQKGSTTKMCIVLLITIVVCTIALVVFLET